jgi:hypothetical protein
MPTPTSPEALATVTARYERTAGRVAARLRAMALEVERHTPARAASIIHARGDYSAAAAEIVADVTSGVANLHLADLVRDAAEVDYLTAHLPEEH